jgi:hypothetical protein
MSVPLTQHTGELVSMSNEIVPMLSRSLRSATASFAISQWKALEQARTPLYDQWRETTRQAQVGTASLNHWVNGVKQLSAVHRAAAESSQSKALNKLLSDPSSVLHAPPTPNADTGVADASAGPGGASLKLFGASMRMELEREARTALMLEGMHAQQLQPLVAQYQNSVAQLVKTGNGGVQELEATVKAAEHAMGTLTGAHKAVQNARRAADNSEAGNASFSTSAKTLGLGVDQRAGLLTLRQILITRSPRAQTATEGEDLWLAERHLRKCIKQLRAVQENFATKVVGELGKSFLALEKTRHDGMHDALAAIAASSSAAYAASANSWNSVADSVNVTRPAATMEISTAEAQIDGAAEAARQAHFSFDNLAPIGKTKVRHHQACMTPPPPLP